MRKDKGVTERESAKQDRWAEWLLERRFGGDRKVMEESLGRLRGWRDRILEGAALASGETLLDVGAGDGLVAFGALEQVPGSRVVFADISHDLLRHSVALAEGIGVGERATFVQAPAERLPLAGAAVDVVTTRSVLIYVADKVGAFSEFYRVLRPGGRMSLFEPINSYFEREERREIWGIEVGAVWPVAQKVRALYESLQPPESDPMLDFDDRDLVALAEGAGFEAVALTLEVLVRPWPEGVAWETLVNTAANPKIPTLAEAMAEVLTVAEREALVAEMRPKVEAGDGVMRRAMALVRGRKEGGG